MSPTFMCRTRGWLAGLLALVVVFSGLVAAPAQAQDEPPDEELPGVECPDFAGAPAADDEFTAYQYALACGVDVEVRDLRDVDRQVFATPDGLLDAQIAVEPYWVQDETGAWVDIDPELAPQVDGSAAAAATVIDIAVGAGGDAPFVTATDPDGGSLSLTWPDGGLPAPELDGPVATYPEVLPDVDLAVQAEPVGFSWVLVVKTAEAAADPALAEIAIGIDTDGLDVAKDPETGRIDVIDESGEVIFEAGQAIMWDSSVAGGESGAAAAEAPPGEPEPEPGRIGEVEVEVTGAGVELTPDAEMLVDETVSYPVYIDPPFTSTRNAWANVYAGAKSRGWTGDSSWPRSGGMRVGYNTWSNCGDGCGLWRSVITMNIDKLKGRYIHSARVQALQTHTGGCGSYGLQLWRTQKISNGVSWNGVTWLYGSQLQSKSVASSNSTGGCGTANPNRWVSFDGANVKKRVQSAADQRNSTISFGLRSSSEGDRNAWRRIQTSSVKLHVEYYLYPPKPDQRKLNGQSCKTSASKADWVTSRHPTISVRARSQESESIYVRLRVRKLGAASNYWYYRTPDPVGASSTVNRRISTSLPDGEYTWQARSDSRQTASVNSGYTNLCYFNVDATKPTQPSVSAPDGPFTEGQDVVIAVASTDPLVNGVRSGLNRYEYSWNTPTYDRSAASSGAATITRGNAAAGRHVLYLRSVDNAGNTSNERTYTFFVGRDIPATPMGMWRFEQDALDDSGHGHDLTMANGGAAVFGADGDGRADAALELDGGSCLTGQAPIRTDAAFSVALWLRSDSGNTTYQKVLTQGGPDHSMYQIQHTPGTDELSFNLLSENYQWYSLRADNPAAPGEWVHVAGTYDPDAGLSRMYVNGQLAGERSVDFEPWNGADTFEVGCLRSASGSVGHFLDGAVDGIGIWQGLLTHSQVRAAMKDLPVAAELARWEFRNGGEDSSRFGRDLAIPDHIEAGEDPYHRPDGTIELDGETCLEYPEPIVSTQRSFAIATWVRVDDADGIGAIASTFSAEDLNGFELWVAEDPFERGDYSFGMQQFPGSWGFIDYGDWHHVAFSYDVTTDRVSTYLDGELFRTSANTNHPDAQVPLTDPFLIGCSYYPTVDGDLQRMFHFDGALHDLRLWRGPLSEVEIASMVGNPPAELGGRWRLEGRGDDTSGNGHGVSFEGDTQFNDGWSCDPDSALELSGNGSARTDGPVVATDESFTVSAWVRLDRLNADQTVVAAAGAHTSAFRLRFSVSQQQFGFVMMGEDAPAASGRTVYGGPTPEVDTWYHLVGVYDLRAGEMRFYLSGELVGTRTGTTGPWRADGPLLLGAAGTAGGSRNQHLHGAVDDVVVWQGAVPDRIVGQISAAPVPMC